MNRVILLEEKRKQTSYMGENLLEIGMAHDAESEATSNVPYCPVEAA